MESFGQQSLSFPKRPQISKNFKAKNIDLVSNHFKISNLMDQPLIYQYSIEIVKHLENDLKQSIPEDDRTQASNVFRAAKKDLNKTFKDKYFRSGRLFYSHVLLTEPKTIEANHEENRYIITFKKVKDLNISNETLQDPNNVQPILQFINICTKEFFRKKGYQEWGRNLKFYDPSCIDIAQHRLKIHLGWKTACGIYQNWAPRILIDFTSKILRKQSVLEFMKQVGLQYPNRIKNSLIGCSVVATYGNYRMWRIDDIAFQLNPGTKFETKSGVEISLMDYYKDHYNIKLQDKYQPIIISKDKYERVYYILPELVHLTGLSEEMRRDQKLMQDVAKFTRLNASSRLDKISGINGDLKDYLEDYSRIKLDSNNPVKGYMLPAPQIMLGDNKLLEPSKGNFNIQCPVFQPADIKNWLFIYADFDGSNQDNDSPLKTFLRTMPKCKKEFGIAIGQPKTCPVQERDAGFFRQKLVENIEAHNPQIVLAFYPKEQKNEWYKVLKDVCLKEKGVPSQALVTNSLMKSPESVCKKVLLQMNVKVGKAPWIAKVPEGLPKRTMIIGADVFHKADSKLKSCIGFCSSTDPQCTRFYSQIDFQKNGQEIMQGIAILMKKAIIAFYNASKCLPECIIFFRDGVAENQIQSILEIETKAILRELESIYKKPELIKFAEIIVNKRIDDRLFTKFLPADGRNQANPQGNVPTYYNPPGGTVVNQDIVSNDFEYLLVSQNVSQGTSTPTRYKVIYNSTDLTQDMFWNLTYGQCYNYYNWTGPIRVPGPVKYAHTLAYQIGKTLQESPNKNLENTLYFL